MRILLSSAVAAIVALAYFSAQSAEKKRAAPDSPADVSRKENLVGAWRLAWMEAPGSDGKLTRITDVTGMLLYTRDGHMSVQLMYPKSASDLTNDYVKNGYEASFGSYVVNEEAHTVTHQVVGSITAGLIGNDLPRMYQFSHGQLIIKSARPDEHWSATWEHY